MSTSTPLPPPPTDTSSQRPASVVRTTLLALLALGLSLGLTKWFNTFGAESYTGYLQAETIKVTANGTGRIERILVNEGERSEVGQALLVLSDNTLESELADKQREILQLEAELNRAQAQADIDLAWRTKELETELLNARLQSANYLKSEYDEKLQTHAWQDFLNQESTRRAELSKPEQVFQPVAHRNLLPRESHMRALLEHEAAANAAEVSAVQLELCEQRIRDLEQLRTELPTKIRRAQGVDDYEAKLARAKEELVELEAREPVQQIAAPTHGRLGLYRRKVGDRVTHGDSIVDIFDEDRRYLTVSLPTKDLPGLAAGTEVTLTFPNAQTRSGRVRDIPTQTANVFQCDTSGECREAAVTLHIEPSEKLWPIVPIGTAIEVKIDNID